MDKFAVDIDQVLNDFEYSELTDQYTTRHEHERRSHTGAGYSQNNVTKHSINNVFHSLNEYLNTSINEKPTVDPTRSYDKDNFNKIDNISLIDNKNNGSSFKNQDVSNDKTENNELISVDEPKNDILLIDNVDEAAAISKFDDFIQNNETKIEDIIPVINESTVEILEHKIDEKISELQQEIENKSEGFEVNTIDNNTGETCLNNEAEGVKNSEKVVEIIQNNLIDEISEPEVEADEKEIREVEPEISELENKINTDELLLNEPIIDVKITDDNISIEIQTDRTFVDENVEHNNVDSVDTTTKNNEIIVISDEISNNIQSSEKKNIVTSEIETSEHPDTQNNVSDIKPIGFNDDLNLDDSQLNKLLDELDDLEEDPKSVEKSHEINEKLNQSEDITIKNNTEDVSSSISRPQNLDLQVNEKVIDLVGAPGHTPYNNVYVNKEIPKIETTENNNSDSEYSSASVSPTFSDISTESTSTASTVSVEGIERRKAEEVCSEVNKNVKNSDEVSEDSKLEEARGIDTGRVEECRNVSADEEQNSEDTTRNLAHNSEELSEPSEEVRTRTLATVAGDSGDDDKAWIGKQAPLWVPDEDATACLHCDMKFTVLKRRHHCRGCGLVLCSKCCSLRFKLQYLEAEARVCNKCYNILNKGDAQSSSASEASPEAGNSPFRPNPSNPLEYCSTVPPPQQAVASTSGNPPAVMVPVGVLKRKGSNKAKHNKSVMFCDGIKPGSDLTNLDNDFNYTNKVAEKTKDPVDKNEQPQTSQSSQSSQSTQSAVVPKVNKNLPVVDPETKSFIPSAESSLPPTVSINKTDITYTECSNTPSVVEMLKNETLTFALQVNFLVHVRIINMKCCINKMAWCFSTEGLMNVGNDEIVYLIEYIDEENLVPKDIFIHLHNIYVEAAKGTSIEEMGISLHNTSNFLDDKNHAGFVYIRPTFQCVENVIQPSDPYLVGILIHRWEMPWAKLFPIRLVLRLGAEYRYYPSPLISTRHRDSTFVEIGHTIINLLADFRNFSYTIPRARGLAIHMEDKNTTVNIPMNRYDMIVKTINNSSEHILAFAGCFSLLADSHLVCIQDTQDSGATNNNYSSHAINIHNRPRKVTGASFIVFNGALKSSSGLTAKSNIVEDGLMIQVLPEEMRKLRDALKAMEEYSISCGSASGPGDEVVNIVWVDNDTNFNMGVKSPIDKMQMNGIPSIRVHNGKDYFCHSGNRLIRWTEVFVLKSGEENPKKLNQDLVNMTKVSESVAKAACSALVKYLDLLVTNSFYKIGIRTTLHVENVSYCAGSNGVKLPPIYMKSLDNELIPVLHRITSNHLAENHIELELIFRILNV